MGLVAWTPIFPGVGWAWKASASSSVKLRLSFAMVWTLPEGLHAVAALGREA